ncbi:MAG: T9SS type A sorting domain-containing protein [Candidatus Cloacimonadota bacterium]|nr:T9SS type A sorting domain-containing protein [Candidatus Cloacimonadota bacterium]
MVTNFQRYRITTYYRINKKFPNPFNPEIKINFSLKEASHMKIEIFNIKGQKVTTLLNQPMDRGNHQVTWNGTTKGKKITSGIYYYEMTIDNYSNLKKMLLLK